MLVPSQQYMSASGPRSRGARVHPRPYQGLSSLGCGRVRPLAWCSRPRSSTALLEGALVGRSFRLGEGAGDAGAPAIPNLALLVPAVSACLAVPPIGPLAPVDDHGHVRVVLVVLD